MQLKILIFGFLFVIISFVFNSYSLWRIFSLLVGIILLVIISEKLLKRKYLFILMPIVLIVLSYSLDFFLVSKFNRVPIYSLKKESNPLVLTYNSFFYRIFKCQNTSIMDYGYESNFLCNYDLLEEIDVNSFLSDSLANFRKYKNKFVKIKGKISKKSGVNSLELSSYKIDDANKLNGYVSFNTEYKVKVNTNSNLSKFYIYDDVTIIGIVDSLTKEPFTINIIDPIIIPSDIYYQYTYEVITSDNKAVSNYVEKQNIYTWGIENIYIHYDLEHIYELKYLINDERITIASLINNKEYTEVYSNEENLIGKIYEMDKFKILKCENSKIIITNEEWKLNYELCS